MSLAKFIAASRLVARLASQAGQTIHSSITRTSLHDNLLLAGRAEATSRHNRKRAVAMFCPA